MKIIAHRGVHGEFPENTLRAFERALEIGVDMIEADLQLTGDRRLILRHDDLICLEGVWHSVGTLSSKTLQTLDLGGGAKMPFLEEFLDQFCGRIPLVLEIKASGTAPLLAARLKPLKGKGEIQVTSFLREELQAMAALCPDCPRSLVLTALLPGYETVLKAEGIDTVSLFRGFLKEADVRRLIGLGIRVRAYPVNLPEEAERLGTWGLEGIFTDEPAAMQGLRTAGGSGRERNP